MIGHILNIGRKSPRSIRHVPLVGKSQIDPEMVVSGSDEVLAIVRNITESKRTEKSLNEYKNHLEELVKERTEQVLKLEEQKSVMERLASQGRVAAGIAHEINNPIAAIKNAFLLIKNLVPTEHQYHHYVGRIDYEIERVARIIRQMFQLYNPDIETRSRVDILFLIDDLCKMLESKIKMKNLNIELKAAEECS